jgi:23S rRNA pseudouridine1911/1915/1917 synthase
MLHAAELGFVHPVSGEALRFSSPLPADMLRVLAWLRKDYAGPSGSSPTR